MSDDVQMVSIDEITPNPWNPNQVPDHVMEALAKNVDRAGFNQPVLVRRKPDGGYEVIDGEHRWRVARRAGHTEIPVIVRDMNDAEARAQTVAMNKLRGEMDPADVAALVKEIEGDIPLDELAQFTGYKLDELDALMKISDFDFDSLPGLMDLPQPDPDDMWETLTFRVPEAVARIVESELERLMGILDSEHQHMALEAMAVNSANTPAESLQ